MPRDATAAGERNIELVAGDASRPTICKKTLAHLATLMIGCLHSRDGPSARRGGNIRAAGASLDLLRRRLRRKSLALLLLATLLPFSLGTFARISLLYCTLLWSALYGCGRLWPSALYGRGRRRRSAGGRTWRWRPSHLPGSGRRCGTCRGWRGPGGRGGPRCSARRRWRRLSAGFVGALRQCSRIVLHRAQKRECKRCSEYWLHYAIHLSSFGVGLAREGQRFCSLEVPRVIGA